MDKEIANKIINNLYDDCLHYQNWDTNDEDNWEAMRESLQQLADFAGLIIEAKE